MRSPFLTDPMTMASSWLVMNILLAFLAFVVVAGLPLWALWRYSADDLFGRPDRPLSNRHPDTDGSAGAPQHPARLPRSHLVRR